MAYKFQFGSAIMSGALTQEGDLNILDDEGAGGALKIGGTQVISALRAVSGSTLDGQIINPATAMVNVDTADIAEGTRLYYTDARARASVSITDAGGDGSFAYNNSTGVFTYTGPSAAEARAHVSVTDAGGDGSLAYNNGTGVFTYTGPSAAEARLHLSASSTNSISASYSKATGIMTAKVQSLTEFDTGDLSEGSNLYYTDARARGAISMEADRFIAYNGSSGAFTMDETLFSGSARGLISVTDAGGDGSMAYNASTGVLTYTGPSSAEARAHLSVTDAGGDGSLAYNNGTGVFTYTGPSATEVRAHFSASMGQTISSSYAAGVFASNLMATAAGDGLGFSSGILSVNVDDSSIETNGDAIRVKAAGLTDAMMNDDVATGLAGSGLVASSGVMAVGVDDSGIEINSDALRLKDNGVTLAKMAGLARGKFIVGDASGDPSALSVGSAHQFLQSDGTDLAYVSMSGDATLAAGVLSIGATKVTDAMLNDDAATGLAGDGLSAASGVMALDLNELTAATINVAADSFPFVDADGNVTRKESIVDLVTGIGGDGLAAVSGVLALDVFELSAAAVDVAADSIAIVDASDSNFTRKESIADLVTAMAGPGLSASGGVLTVESAATPAARGDANATLTEGFNFGSATLTADRTWTLPASPSAGDVVRVKAPQDLGGNRLIISKAGSHAIDGADTIDLESPGAAINMIYVGSNAWLIF